MQSNATSFCSVQNSLGCVWRENCLLYCFFPSWKQTPALWSPVAFAIRLLPTKQITMCFLDIWHWVSILALNDEIHSTLLDPAFLSSESTMWTLYQIFFLKRNNINRTIYNTPQEKGFRVSNFSWTVAGLDQTFSGCDPPWSSWQERWCLDKIRRKYKTWK